MFKMIKLMQEKIESLRDEITAIDLTSSMNNLKMVKHDKRQIICLKAKIQVINELILSFGVRK